MSTDPQQYLPPAPASPVVQPGEFIFAASHFDHPHIYGQISGLIGAGGVCKSIHEPRAELLEPVKHLLKNGTRTVDRFGDILDDPDIHLLTAAAVPDQRCAIGMQVLEAGKDYFTDKSPFTTLGQLAEARAKVAATGRKYMVCYSERLQSEAAWQAGELVARGELGRVLQVLNLAPHNLGPEARPEWFFNKSCYGGILTDIGSHQFEQFLAYAGAGDAILHHARVENFAHPDYPELEDFGEASLTLDSGASAYCRMDWFNPAASRTWGDGRTFILGDKGYLEIRKNIDVARPHGGNRIYLVNDSTELEIDCNGRVGFPFFGELILDVLNRSENAMTQKHAFKAAELSLKAQAMADAAKAT